MTIQRVQRVFRLQQAAGELRTMQFEDRDHLVVPVVALVEGVIHPVNVKIPELVLASEIAPTVGAWNGEPVTFDHPHVGGTRVTANDPRVLEEFMVGRLFNSRMDDLKLRVEAWLDLLRAASMGGLAQELVDRVLAGELIEVSVGAFVLAEKLEGVHNGKRFGAVWREVGPDHLAMLPAGTIGACSNEMGCGAGVHASAGVLEVAEAAKAEALELHSDAIGLDYSSKQAEREGLLHVLTADGLLGPTSTEEGPVIKASSTEGGLGKLRTFAERFKGLGQILLRNAQGDMSDNDLRQLLHAALFSTEPAFLFIEAVFPVEQLVVYAVEPDGEFQWFERSFTIADDNEVSFGEATEVVPTTIFEPVVAAAAAACTCDDPAACNCGAQQHEDANMDKTARIAALIANQDSPFTDASRSHLETVSDEVLGALEARLEDTEPVADPEKQKPEPVDPVAPAPAADVPDPAAAADPAATPKPDAQPMPVAAEMSETEWMAAAPPQIRAALGREIQREAAQKAAMVTALTDTQDVYTAEQLGEMDVDRLREVQRLCAGKGADPVVIEGVDFVGMGLPRASQANNEETIDAPPSLRTAVADAAK